MFVSTYAGAVAGIDAVKVTVEVNLTGGGLGLYLVGLPDNAVKESEQRIRAAFENTGRKMSGRKVVVNLAPADLRKEGAGFDLPIAVGILAAMSEVSGELLPTTMFAGELSLDGTLRPVRGVLPLAVKARDEGLRRLVVPAENAAEAAVVEGVEVYGLHSLGEVSLAHNGVLFLDELPEFGRSVLEVLRQPLEDKKIMVSRARYSVEYPANFTLVAAMNPCPCGYYNHPTKECTCPPGAVHRYMGRISGPLLDRIDLQVEVTPVAIGEISQVRPSEPSAAIRERVIRAREVQAERFRGVPGVHTNAMMNARMLREFCPLDQVARELLERAMVRLDLSARAYDRIVKVARTIADLEGTADIGAAHLAEAINYRSLDRGSWGR